MTPFGVRYQGVLPRVALLKGRGWEESGPAGDEEVKMGAGADVGWLLSDAGGVGSWSKSTLYPSYNTAQVGWTELGTALFNESR